MPNVTATASSAGDIWVELAKTAGSVTTTHQNGRIGHYQALKTSSHEGVFVRFDFTIPTGSKIQAVKLSFTTSGVGNGSTMPNTAVGFLDRDGKWDASSAFGEYTARNQLPFAWWSAGTGTDSTVWKDDAPAFTTTTTINSTANQEWSFYDYPSGYSGTGTLSVSGLVSQLQEIVDDDLISPLPLCLHVLKSSTSNSNTYQGVRLANHATSSYHPTLTIQYNAPPTLTITNPSSGHSAIEGASVTFSATSTDVDDGDLASSIAWSSSIDGSLGTGASVTTSSLSAGTHTITASSTDTGLGGNSYTGDALTTTQTVSVTIDAAPTVTITTPAGNVSGNAGDSVSLAGTATDTEDGSLSSSIAWSSSLDGSLGTGASITASSLSAGAHTITASVTDSAGQSATATRTVTLNAAPTVSITAPTGNVWVGDAVTFAGTASDAEDGSLSSSIAWSSSISGSLGTGASVTVSSLAAGTHTITASVTDSGGTTTAATSSVVATEKPKVRIRARRDMGPAVTSKTAKTRALTARFSLSEAVTARPELET